MCLGAVCVMSCHDVVSLCGQTYIRHPKVIEDFECKCGLDVLVAHWKEAHLEQMALLLLLTISAVAPLDPYPMYTRDIHDSELMAISRE